MVALTPLEVDWPPGPIRYLSLLSLKTTGLCPLVGIRETAPGGYTLELG
jgi:hypothetical protein